jgi:PAS domain S-box-containing protein
MKKLSELDRRYALTRDRIIGLGERSVRKSYYPQLRQRLLELERFRFLLDRTHDLILVVRLPDGAVTDFNQSAPRLTGFTPEELRALKVEALMPELSPRLADPARATGEPSAAGTLVTHLRRRDASRLPVEVTVETAHWNGSVNAVIVARDITDRLQAETEMTFLEKQLRQAQKMEAVGTLAGGIAHDFNNILSAVIGFAEMAIDETPPDSSLRHSMQQVLKAGLRAKNLVKQILAFSRQSEQELHPLQLRKVVQEAGELLRASLPTTIEIRREIRSNAFVLADPTQMHQVLMNLCTNAAHAMRTHGGTLTIGLEDLEAPPPAVDAQMELLPGAYLRLTVRDTGVGIPGALLERIFDPFFTTKGVGEGTGMGLSVAHGIVKAHGGTIGVTSQEGRGTTFTVLLPAISPSDEGALSRPTALPGGSERILVVDDEAMLAQMTAQLLERLGYRVTAETSSPRALERFRRSPGEFDLVITDMTMPGVTGKELALEILALRPQLPVILCTGFSEVIDEPSARAIGIRAFTMKPIVMRELAETVRRVLDGG